MWLLVDQIKNLYPHSHRKSSILAKHDYLQITVCSCTSHTLRYIHGNAILHEMHDDPCVDALTRILNATGSFEIDERSHTVEIITRKNVSVKDSVECVIMPENLLRDASIREFLDQNGIKHMEYTVRRLTAPSRYNEVVFEKAMEYIRMRKGDA